MRGVAYQGGGSHAEVADADALTDALLEVFVQVQAVDSVFSAVSLPLSAHSQDTFADQVFVGMFRPDPLAGPRWFGNLKQYGIGYDLVTDSLQLVDSMNRPAISAATGFIEPGAVSFWTSPSQFWINSPSGTPPSASDSPDGEIVEKGGAAQRLRERLASSQAARSVFTCIGCPEGSALSTSRFDRNNASITPAMLGAADAAERDALIDWVRGADNAADEKGPGSPTTVRPSVHGDVLHSRPVVVDYGGDLGAVVFYGSNDGMLRAVGGAKSGANAGQELWSFVAPEFFGRFGRLRDNWPPVGYPSMPAGMPTESRGYFFDGPIGVYRNQSTRTTIIYPTMRRGGHVVYAIDVSEPLEPRFLWKKTPRDLSVLAQTWSEPRVARIRGYAGPVLIFGAGYDAAAEDADPAAATTAGNSIIPWTPSTDGCCANSPAPTAA